MAYTSSALSFLLEDLGKTVVWFHSVVFPVPLIMRKCADRNRGTNTPFTAPK